MHKRIMSFLLAVVMLVSMSQPVLAQIIQSPIEIVDVTEDFPAVEIISIAPNVSDVPDIPFDKGDSVLNDEDDDDTIELGIEPLLSSQSSPAISDDGYFILDCTPEQAAKIIAFYEYARTQIENPPMFMPFAAPGDTGTASWSWGESVGVDIGGYYINNILSITLNTANMPIGRAFCFEFGPDPGGNYTASQGSNNQVLRLLIAYHNGSATAVGVQLALWSISNGLPFNSHPEAAAAVAAASSVSTTGYTYYLWSSGSGQPFVTLDEDDDDPDPDPDPDPGYRIEVDTHTETQTMIQSFTTYEYSDAIGQITVTKRDQDGKSLDGAIFRIVVQFTNGQQIIDTAFEVYNGSRLFTYTHPADNHQPATVTVTEISAPDGYTFNPTPQTAIVHPTYTRITKVTTHTITITTTTTTTTVIEIESGDVVSESTATATAQTELNPPVVQEYVDFVHGDRNITLTFVNNIRPSELVIFKYRTGTGTPLQGAQFEVSYVDPAVHSGRWTVTTGLNGTATINLPRPGAILIRETSPPAGHVITAAGPDTTVTVLAGEKKQVDIPNDPYTAIEVTKIDSVTGLPLAGATISLKHITSGMEFQRVTGANGIAMFENVEPGSYYVEEIKAPDRYVLNTTRFPVQLRSGEVAAVTIPNDPYTGVEVIKVDSVTGARLSGATISLKHVTTGIEYRLVTNASGVALFENKEPGSYYVEEIVAPNRYVLNTTRFPVQLRSGELASVTIPNDPYTGIEVTKIDANNGQRLAGAHIRIKHITSGQEYTGVTDANGIVYFGLIVPGNYYVEEIQAPFGYILNPTVFPLELRTGELATLTIPNYRKNGLYIRKVDENGLPLAGAVFELRRGSGQVLHRDTTDANGIVFREFLVTDNYVIEEIQAPVGYMKDENNPQTIFIDTTDDNKTFTVTFVNKKKPSIHITKVDADTNKPLQGAVFRISEHGGTKTWDITTGFDGIAILENLEIDTAYLVEEIKAPTGYVNSGHSQIIVLEECREHTIVVGNHSMPGLRIEKIDEGGGGRLSGAVFRVAKHGTTEHIDVTTGFDGTVTLQNPEPGWYVVTETRAPNGYLLDSTPHEIFVEAGKTAVLVVNNGKLPTLTITKIDEKTGIALSGAVFRVAKKGGSEYTDIMTGSSQSASIQGKAVLDLEPGWYVITEIRAPSGYVLDDTPHEVELKPGENAAITINNNKMPTLTIRKVDGQTGAGLPGAILRVSQGDVFQDVITGNGGIVRITGMPPGWYTITELQAPVGYLLDDTPHRVQMIAGEDAEVVIQNKRKSSITIRKIDEVTKQPLAHARFRVSIRDGRTLGEFTTDGLGRIILRDIEPAMYILEEIQAPSGYIILEAKKEITLGWGEDAVVEFSNQPMNPIIINKADAQTGAPLAGARYRVSRVSGEVIGEYETGASGMVSVTGIMPGWYTVLEIKPPTGYILDNTPKNVELKLDSTATVLFENYRLNGLLIRKFDSLTWEPLPGTKFTLHRKGGSLIGEYTTDASGEIAIEGLEAGWYTITETSAPQGYINDDPVRDVEFQQGQFTIVEFSNSRKSPLQIIKVDGKTGEPLSGARFRVTAVNGTFVTDLTTDRFGFAVAENLDPGWYVVTETQAPEGYIIDTAPRNIEVKSNIPAYIEFPNSKLSVLQIQKRDADTGMPLAGARFRVTTTEGTLIGEFTTGADGFINIPGLSPDSYIVTELIAPNGYQLDSVPKTVVLRADGTGYVEFRNNKLPGLQVRKADSATGAPLPGVRFRIEKMNGERIGDFVTNYAGFFVISDLEAGWYTVYELQGLDGYIKDPTPQNVELKPNANAVVEFTNDRLPGLQVRKVDAATNEPLSGARFRVERLDGQRIGDYTTNNAGFFIVPDLPAAVYVVYELQAPAGYILDATPQTVELKANETATIEFTNRQLAGLRIRKVDSLTNEPLSGARFRVSHKGGASIGEYITDAQGGIVIADLAPGWYTVEEITAPDGYLRDGTPRDVELRWGQLATVEVMNKRLPGLQVRKIDAATGEPLPGAKFRVERMSGELVGNYTTNAAGFFVVPDLPVGWYSVYETEAPAGFILDMTPQNVELKANNTAVLEFLNKPLAGLRIRKIDSQSHESLSGARFRVSQKSGNVIGDYLTETQVGVMIAELEPGWYTIEETIAPNGYQISELPKDVELVWGQIATVDFMNDRLPGLQVQKYDADTGEPLPGVRFRVEKINGERIGDFVTNLAGFFVISDLTAGWYVVYETQALDGYIKDASPQNVELKPNSTAVIDFTNRKLPGLQVRKVDAVTGAPLPGARFRVEKINGERVGDFTTNSAGFFVVSDIPTGWYTVYETQSPAGYIPDSTPQNVELKPNSTAVIDFRNQPLSGLRIRKIDSQSHEPLYGARFRVSHKNGEVVGSYMTDAQGSIFIDGLAPGWYTIEEIAAPDGYQRDVMPLDVQVRSGQLSSAEFTNRRLPGLQVRKIDAATGEPLSGARFRVDKMNGELVGNYTTNAAGFFIVPDLAAGWYTVYETQPPSGYVLDSTPQNVELKTNSTAVVEFMNNRLPGLQVRKKDADTGGPLPGVTFRVEKMNGERVGDYTTNAAGFFTVSDLPAGWYTVYETQSISGYIKDATPQNVELKPNSSAVIDFTNKKLPGLQVQKIDSVTGAPVSGARFRVEHMSGERVGDYTTNAAGFFIVPDIAEGWYTVFETQSPAGYLLDTTPQNVELKANGTAFVEFINKPLAGLHIKKVDTQTREPLSGARFRVTHKGSIIGEYTTDSQGSITLSNLEAGQYIIEETAAPDGYQVNTTPRTAELEWGRFTSVEITNRRLPGLQVRKIDASNNAPLSGARFRVERMNGEVVGNYTTNAAGFFVIPDLTAGWYTVYETQAPTGYVLDTTPQNVELRANTTAVLEFQNRPLGSLRIRKIAEQTFEPLGMARFRVSHKNGAVVGDYFTDSTGSILISGLEPGWYTVEETAAPEGYQADVMPKDVELRWGQTASVEFTNKRLPGLQVRKSDAATGEPLPGVRFRVEKQNGERIGDYTTNSAGFFNVPNLAAGWYTVYETHTIDGYIKDATPQSVELKGNTTATLEFENRKLPGLQVRKVDTSTNAPLSGARFRVERMNGELVGNYTTNAAGFFVVTELSAGWYVVYETQAPSGYVLDATPQTIELKASGTTTIEFKNKALSGLSIRKIDNQTHQPLSGARFRVSIRNGAFIGEYTSDAQGSIFIDGLEPGWYTVVETAAPDGYQLDNTSKDVELRLGQTANVEFTNKKLNGLQVRKVDAVTGAPLSGARFRVEKQEGQNISYVGDYTTNSTGFFVVPNLTTGWYTVTETHAPAGYVKDSAPQSIELKGNTTAILEFLNQPLSEIRIRKIDTQTGEPLAGARFRISHRGGGLIGEYITDRSGLVHVDGLEAGWYTIEETLAPDGYQIDSLPRDIQLRWGQTATVEFLNKRLPGLQVRKSDSVTGAPLSGVRFRVERVNGERVGDYVTGSAGFFVVPDLPAGFYIVYETQTIAGYIKDATPQTVELKTGTASLEFTNDRLPGLQVRKVDANTGAALSGAKFRVDRINGERVGDYTTNSAGFFIVPDLPAGWYSIYETQAPAGYVLDKTAQVVELKPNNTATLEFENHQLNGLHIRKIDSQTRNPLAGAKFRITQKGGGLIGEHTTDVQGSIFIDGLEPGWYTIVETAAPNGYHTDSTPKDIELRLGQTGNVEFTNDRLPGLQVKKLDSGTGAPLSGARFRVDKLNGERVGDYTTNDAGFFIVTDLPAGVYTVYETFAPAGYVKDATPKNVELKPNSTAVVEFFNDRLSSLRVNKVDSVTREPLPGVNFRVDRMDGQRVGDFVTNNAGFFIIPNLTAGVYTVYETQTINGYIKDATPQTVELKPNEDAVVEFRNDRLPGLQVKKSDASTGAPVSGAVFRLERQNGERIGDYSTNGAGFFIIPELPAGMYTVYETGAPVGYIHDATPQTVELKPNETAVVEFKNRPLATLQIRKIDSQNREPLPGAKFRVSIKGGVPIGEYTTDASGNILLERLSPGWYTIEETFAPDGYHLDTAPRDIELQWGQLSAVEIVNHRLPGLQVNKVDAATGEPLSGARFRVDRLNGVNIGEYVTNAAGFFVVPNLPAGWYTVYETQAPSGYIKDATPRSVELKVNETAVMEFQNKPLASLSIRKVDSQTLEPLPRARFRVSIKGGSVLGEYLTDAQGGIVIAGLEPGWYTIEETAAPDGYQLDVVPKDIELRWGQVSHVEFMNDRLPGLQVKKVDAITNNPLAGATFRVEKQNGEHIGDFTTNTGGFFVLTDLPVGWYTVYETAAPAGYILDATPQNVELKVNGTAVVEFLNRPLAGLQIRKVDDVTGLPLSGVEFSITELDGKKVGDFTTDDNGLIFVPNLNEGYLIVVETKALPGYKPESAPRTIGVRSENLNILEYRNKAYPFLQIKKVDGETGKAIAGVKFKVFDANTRELGEFTTNELGIIRLTGMEAGTYYIRETKAADGYELDDTLKEVNVFWGKTTTIEVKNTPMASLRIRKVDSVTGAPLSGAEFILYNARNNIVGEYVSDANGLIEFPSNLPAGRYNLKEIKAPKGYVLLDKPVTVELKAGTTTDVTIPNNPERGTIQITKKAESDNEVSKHKAGAVLAGAVFEVVNEKKEVVDTIITDNRGMATTKDLPLGKYAIREIKAPDYYLIDDGVFYAEIKLHGDVVRFEVMNIPAEIAVTVDKRGNAEALTGDLIRYDFSNISNTGNIALDEFYWHDQLPTDAVRLEKLVTGTWNERLTYRVVYNTNLKTDYRVWRDNLLTTVNNELDVTDLRLAANEYVTSFRVEFGTVEPGFREDSAPYIMTRVLEGLEHEYRFVNKTDAGGRIGGEIIYNTDSWVTVVFAKPRGSLPKTGL